VQLLINILLSLVPVLLFLAALVLLDSFKLLRLRAILMTIGVGCGVALVSFLINSRLIDALSLPSSSYSRYVAPLIEETLKAGFIVYLIKTRKVGFMVDAAICGFAAGAGFALVENIYYLGAITASSPLVWLVRGLGTAVMHGGTTAVFAIVAGKLSEQHASLNWRGGVGALGLAVVIHSLYNHFFVPPVPSTILLLIALPLVIYIVFQLSEKATQEWLGVGLDTDMELLAMLSRGDVSTTRVGEYFKTLQGSFPGPVVADMLCYVRLHVELSIRAKGILMMRASGFTPAMDIHVSEKFDELKYLETSMGPTGKLALVPFLHTSRRELWQIYMLKDMQN
jgi:RsiW-degrading membrane proteinase PrsW (M82 family)